MGLDKCIKPYVHLYNIIQSIFTALKIFCALPVISSPLPLATANLFIYLFIVFIVLPLAERYTIGIIEYVDFSDCLLSFSNMHLMFLHVFSQLNSSFHFKDK